MFQQAVSLPVVNHRTEIVGVTNARGVLPFIHVLGDANYSILRLMGKSRQRGLTFFAFFLEYQIVC